MRRFGRRKKSEVVERFREEYRARSEVYSYPEMLGPCVYIFYDENNTPIYVGRSRRGFARVFEIRHPPYHLIGVEAKEVEVLWCEEEPQTILLEGDLIRELTPRLNNTVGRRPTSFGKPLIEE